MKFLTKEEIEYLTKRHLMPVSLEQGYRFLSGFWANDYIAIVFCENPSSEKIYTYIFYKTNKGEINYAYCPNINYLARNLETLIQEVIDIKNAVDNSN